MLIRIFGLIVNVTLSTKVQTKWIKVIIGKPFILLQFIFPYPIAVYRGPNIYNIKKIN